MRARKLSFCALMWDTHYRTGLTTRNMSQLADAIAKYNKSLETGPFRDLAWAEALHHRMEEEKLSAGGRLVCPFLRPNFVSRRQYESLVKTGESLIGAIDRIQQMVLTN